MPMNKKKILLSSTSIAPIIASGVTHLSNTLSEFDQLLKGDRGNENYGRYANSTLTSTEKFLEEKLGAERVLVFSSGMAAVTSTILSLIRTDTKFIYINQCYRKTDDFFKLIAEKFRLNLKG